MKNFVLAAFLVMALLLTSSFLQAAMVDYCIQHGLPMEEDIIGSCNSMCKDRCDELRGDMKQCLKYCGICCRECECSPHWLRRGEMPIYCPCACYTNKKNSTGKPMCP